MSTRARSFELRQHVYGNPQHACIAKILRYLNNELSDADAETFESQLFQDEILAAIVEETLHAMVRYRFSKEEVLELLHSKFTSSLD